MQKKCDLLNGSKENQTKQGLQLFTVFLLISIALFLFFYLFHLILNLPIIFAKMGFFATIFTFGGVFFFLVEIAKIKKHG
jgi:hypothetical protein